MFSCFQIMKHAREYESNRTQLQREIDTETHKLRACSHPARNHPKQPPNTSKSDSQKQPYFYQNETSFKPIERKPYSFNIPDNSIFSANYDVDSYLRKNLNFNKNNVEHLSTNGTTKDRNDAKERTTSSGSENIDTRKLVIEKALIHEPKERKTEKPSKIIYDVNSLSVPVLRHSPKTQAESNDNTSPLSEAMKKVDDKWKVPAVQKNILKSLPNEDGRSISILTQLGSIRRQLQLEQLKLDKMLSKSDS